MIRTTLNCLYRMADKNNTLTGLSVRERMNLWAKRDHEVQSKTPPNKGQSESEQNVSPSKFRSKSVNVITNKPIDKGIISPKSNDPTTPIIDDFNNKTKASTTLFSNSNSTSPNRNQNSTVSTSSNTISSVTNSNYNTSPLNKPSKIIQNESQNIENAVQDLSLKMKDFGLVNKKIDHLQPQTTVTSSSISSSVGGNGVSPNIVDELVKDTLSKIHIYEQASVANQEVKKISAIKELNTSLQLLQQSLLIMSTTTNTSVSTNNNSSSSSTEANIKINRLENELNDAKRKIYLLEQQQMDLLPTHHNNVQQSQSLNNTDNNNSHNNQNISTSSSSQSPSKPSSEMDPGPAAPKELPFHLIIDEEDGKLRIMISKNKRKIMMQDCKV